MDQLKRKKRNRELLRKYPFLRPSPLYVKSTALRHKKYDYSFTILDFINPIYLDKFVFDILRELKNELIKNGDLYNCRLNIDGNFYVDDTYLEIIFYKNFNGDKNQINNILKK